MGYGVVAVVDVVVVVEVAVCVVVVAVIVVSYVNPVLLISLPPEMQNFDSRPMDDY